MTRPARQLLAGTLGGGSAAVHCPNQRMASAETAEADGENAHLLIVGNVVVALGPSNNAPHADAHIGGKRSLPGFAVGDACEPHELLGRDASVTRGALELRGAAGGRALGCESGIGWPASRVPTDAGHPLPLAIASGWRALPWQHRHQGQAGFVGWHG